MACCDQITISSRSTAVYHKYGLLAYQQRHKRPHSVSQRQWIYHWWYMWHLWSVFVKHSDSISFARDCRKLSHGMEVSSCSGPKDIGSCFCSLVFHPGPTTFFGGRVTQTRISNGFIGVEVLLVPEEQQHLARSMHPNVRHGSTHHGLPHHGLLHCCALCHFVPGAECQTDLKKLY